MSQTLRLLTAVLALGIAVLWVTTQTGLLSGETTSAEEPEGSTDPSKPQTLVAGTKTEICVEGAELKALLAGEQRIVLEISAYTPPAQGDGSLRVLWQEGSEPELVAIFPAVAFNAADGEEPKRFSLIGPESGEDGRPLCAGIEIGDAASAESAAPPQATVRLDLVAED